MKFHDSKRNSVRTASRLLLALTLLAAALPAVAQTNYVFYNATYGYLYNDGGTLKSGDLQFDKSSMWVANRNLGNTSATIKSYTEDTYMNGNGLGASTTSWRGNGTYLQYRSGNTTYYFKATNATTFTVNSTQNNGNRYNYYTVTINEGAAELTDFTINSGAETITATGSFGYGHTNANYTPAYTDYIFNNNAHHYVGSDNSTLANVNGTAVTTGYTWSLSSNATGYATVSGGTISVTALPALDLEITLTCSLTYQGITKSDTKTILLQGTTVGQPVITRAGNDVSISCVTTGATIYYTTDGGTPSASSTVYSGPFSIAALTLPVTVKAIAIRNGNSSATATASYSQPACETPVITIGHGGEVTITCATDGATIRYTSGDNPADPTGTSPVFSSLTLTTGQSVKAIATKSGYENSLIASADFVETGVNGGVVTLDDREDHSWSYYSDGSQPIHSLNPADVTIKYYGNGNNVSTSNDASPALSTFTGATTAVRVGIDANCSTFAYYKTLERQNADGTGLCPYTTIPNPFSVRPTYGTGDTRWRGFYAWRIKGVSGGTINGKGVGDTIHAESTVLISPTGEYGMVVELEALWARAYVGSGYQSSVGYERNFVIGGDAVNYPATYSALYPNGTTNGTTAATSVTGTYDPGAARTLDYDTKFEYINLSGNRTYTANNHYLCFGRGISTANNAGTVQGINGGTSDLNYTIRLESGQIYELCFVRASSCTVSGRYCVTSILGCDYDRATGVNTNLSISSGRQLFYATTVTFSGSSNQDAKTFDLVVKSGQYQSTMWSNQNSSGGGGYQNSFYCGQNQGTNNYPGLRYVVIEGGEMGCLNGGRGTNGAKGTYAPSSDETPTFTARIRGGLIHGAVFGGAADSDSPGSREIIVTGGTIEGWIAAGANGTGSSGGTNSARSDGNSYIYVGGNALVGGPNVKTVNATVGGQVFGAGRGQNGQEASINNSNVVIADNAVISGTGGGNVYGGGYTGYVKVLSSVYLLGGTVEGSVFGGAYGNGNDIPDARVVVRGGTVRGGVYGASNSSGTISGTINVDVYATDPHPASGYAIASVFGGGNLADYGGTPNVTVHCTDATAPISIGELYGGGNQASVAGTNVVVGAGNIIGDVFGGGKSASVTGKTSVNIKGGTILSGTINGGAAGGIKVRVDKDGSCPMKIGQVYGGGNEAASQVGLIDIGCTGDRVNTAGGHDDCNETNNRIGYELEGIGDVYGGANAATVTGDVDLTIDSGMVYRVFGANNTSHKVTGTVTVNISKTDDGCGWYVGYVYGGGNQAPYGTANQPYPAVNVSAGAVSYSVFGGGLGGSATVTGNPTVILSGTAQVGGNVYGGGNEASVVGSTSVQLKD